VKAGVIPDYAFKPYGGLQGTTYYWKRLDPVVTLRAARLEDASAVAGIHVRAWQIAYRGLLPDDYLDALRPEDRASRYAFARPEGMSNPDQPKTIVAVKDGSIVGFATTRPSPDSDVPDAAELAALYVDPPMWRSGIGRQLIAEARESLRRSGFHEATLWVLVSNDRAQRFYRADGWQPDGQRRLQEVWGITVDEMRYRRSL
jgi:ribosomal protein S18 acetylase RimI-like enzyme